MLVPIVQVPGHYLSFRFVCVLCLLLIATFSSSLLLLFWRYYVLRTFCHTVSCFRPSYTLLSSSPCVLLLLLLLRNVYGQWLRSSRYDQNILNI